MKYLIRAALGLAFAGISASAQSTFLVTGGALPVSLVKQNYGKLPKGVAAYDLNICNASGVKQSLSSGEVYQALSKANPSFRPLGRQIVLSSILQTQNWSATRVVGLVLSVAVDALSIAIASKSGGKGGPIEAAALSSLSVEQLTTGLKRAASTDQIQKFETQTLETALVLDGGSCAERTVFAVTSAPKPKGAENLSFHVR